MKARLAAGLGAALLGLSGAAHAGDPYLEWRTVATPHYRVHFHGGLEALAQRTATIAERSREKLAPILGPAPDEVTHVLLHDATDSANGSATSLPYDAIRLFVTAPEELSVLGDYDDWMNLLVTHEQVHVFHLDTISGPATLLNAILGKTYAPNNAQPRWILEGLAVALESRLTTGGRLRSTLFDMYLRADVLEDRVMSLDEVTHVPRRWPGGDVWYLYGGKFIGYLLDNYGPDVFAAVSADYGANLMPWGINRSVRRATGRTYPELYDAWLASVRARYAEVDRDVRARGLRVGRRLTLGGRVASSPRHLPRCARRGEAPELLYYRDDGNRIPGFYRLSLRPETPAYDAGLELVERAVGSPRSADVDGDCGLVFDSSLPSLRRYGFDDLVRSPLGPATTGAANVARRRLTSGLRARSPDVSPDGRRVAFVRNHGGTTTLEVADLDASGGLGSPRTAARSRPREQVFSPRFAPDSRRIAYGVWTEGGHRDLRILDLETGVVEELFHDRAVDGQPSFSPDGKTLYFSSDRSGISNIYALDLATRRLRQVTNVLGGAFFPEPSPDGRSLVYVGYTSYGYDLWEIPLREEELLPAPPPPPPRPDPERSAPTERWPVVPYDMTETLGPYRYDVEYGPGTFGDAVTISTSGADMTGQHQFGLAFTWDTGLASPAGSASYTYARLPVWLGTSAFRFVAPRAPVQVGDRRLPVRESIIGATTSVSYPIPLDLASQTVSVSYTASAHDTDFPVARLVDPYADALPRARDYFLGSVRAGYWFSNTAGTAFGLSPEQGVTFSLSTDLAGPFTGSDASLTAVEGRAIGYVLSPIGEHQVLALALSGGTAGGSFPGRGFYYTGGFTDADPYDTVRSGLIQGGFVLRGFPPGAFVGRQYNLANLEYRFPLLWVYRGVSTLPAFLNAFTGTLFADYGGAYDRMDSSDPLAVYRLGVGAELRFGFTLGYFLGTNLRLGVARGFGDGALPGLQTYLVAAAQF